MRRHLQRIDEQQGETSAAIHRSAGLDEAATDASVLRRAMSARDAAAVFAEAAEAGAVDPLTDAEVRLWVGLRPV
jgi:hypothetical protein